MFRKFRTLLSLLLPDASSDPSYCEQRKVEEDDLLPGPADGEDEQASDSPPRVVRRTEDGLCLVDSTGNLHPASPLPGTQLTASLATSSQAQNKGSAKRQSTSLASSLSPAHNNSHATSGSQPSTQVAQASAQTTDHPTLAKESPQNPADPFSSTSDDSAYSSEPSAIQENNLDSSLSSISTPKNMLSLPESSIGPQNNFNPSLASHLSQMPGSSSQASFPAPQQAFAGPQFNFGFMGGNDTTWLGGTGWNGVPMGKFFLSFPVSSSCTHCTHWPLRMLGRVGIPRT